MQGHYNVLFLCTGNSARSIKAFRDSFLMLARRIALFVSLPLASLDKLAIRKEMDRIGREGKCPSRAGR